jgi:hypothetical protein
MALRGRVRRTGAGRQPRGKGRYDYALRTRETEAWNEVEPVRATVIKVMVTTSTSRLFRMSSRAQEDRVKP